MSAAQLGMIFEKAPYMKVADIKMMHFFLNLSMLAIIVLSLIFFFSIFNKNYWCRYFCPYGALIGILGWASAIRIVRNKKTCIDCSKCTVACPVYIEVEKKNIVYDVECLGCYDCVDSCPVNGALDMKLLGFGKKIHYAVYAGLVVGLFVVFMNTARFTGYWHNNVSVQEYTELVQDLDNPRFKHKQGKFEIEE
jgi:NAD-dependent dihydropyrimidine dehydrogenase PreA subunit